MNTLIEVFWSGIPGSYELDLFTDTTSCRVGGRTFNASV